MHARSIPRGDDIGGVPRHSSRMDAIVVEELTKRFGPVLAVDRLSFSVGAGRVTGFLGPNGAGKTTTLGVVLGLVHPTGGSATVNGLRYGDLRDPARQVGAVLEATSFHPGRRARDHLRILATAARLPVSRVDETLDQVGLADAGHRRVGGFSLGMRQHLGLAAALLGDPEILVLDEPTNGLDPDGVRWLRTLVRTLAGEGRTVLVSSHLLSEVAQTVDDVVIITEGRLVAQGSLAEVARRAANQFSVLLRTPQATELRRVLAAAALDVTVERDGALVVSGATPDAVGRAVARAGLTVYEMRPIDHSLEEVFLELTASREGSRR
ncbi:MAG TPA: ABC transporter ATP-binding protein [Acidimicrobiales bacterium]|nr:ABC transporter ATP-binding protein [Acidimicrobiales bacterium]